MRHTNTMEYFSAFNTLEILPFETSSMNLEDIMPSKARQTANTVSRSSLTCGI